VIEYFCKRRNHAGQCHFPQNKSILAFAKPGLRSSGETKARKKFSAAFEAEGAAARPLP
jgi:hypothetical protein